MIYLLQQVTVTATATTTTITTTNSNNNNSINNNNNNLLDDLFGSTTSNGTTSPTKPLPSAAEDDFDPRAGEDSKAESKNEFGNFAAAFDNDAPKSTLEGNFADFTSFSQDSVCPSGGSSNASLLMGMMPSPAAPASTTTSVVNAPSAPANSNTVDLLQGLLGPSHPSTPAPSSTHVMSPIGASADLGGFNSNLSGMTLTQPTCVPLQSMATTSITMDILL
ncbi:hypothetical protein E2C01_046017 [Portunus trituberculatus]|uniref:Uncharacterized protein n=1 Tax=Portunus trituberculatus TaxID=210409 RepID=A0A5B7G3Y2_PORTR|nr:hypothetical protein [Portunus trituberculatus]